MMTPAEKIRLKAKARTVGGRGGLSTLRGGGMIPGVVYGRGLNPVSVSVNSKEMLQAIKAAGLNALLELEVEDSAIKKPVVVMIKDFQTDLITRHITHLDFLQVDMKEEVSVSVSVKLTGKAVGLTKGGIVEQVRRDLEVRCLPGKIPESIEVDITSLDLGDSFHIDDLKLPEGVQIPHDQNFPIVSIVSAKEEAPAPEAAAPAGAEAAAAPTTPTAGTKEEAPGAKGKEEGSKPAAKGKEEGTKKE